eukprot:SAG11_NODE_3035_length_2748_cov_3.895432_3_plen_112_part_00
MMSCRDHLRVAQLLLNRGRWYADDGGAGRLVVGGDRPYTQLLTEAYVDEFLRPSFPVRHAAGSASPTSLLGPAACLSPPLGVCLQPEAYLRGAYGKQGGLGARRSPRATAS